MNRLARLALAAYPPSWRERYGPELAELAADADQGVGADLLVGAARAWLQPAGQRSREARRLSAICTAHVAWCVGFVAMLGYLKQVNDPPLPELTTGWSQPLWGLEKACFFFGWVVLLLGGTVLLAQIAVPALRNREWQVLRPMLPAAVLLVIVLGTIPVVGHFGNGPASPLAVTALLLWLALGLALVIAGAIGPVVSLRRSGLGTAPLRAPLWLSRLLAVTTVVLAVSTIAQAALLSSRVPLATLIPMWAAVALMALAASAAGTSARRAFA